MPKHVLIVDDEPEHFTSFSEELVRLCPDWELTFARSSEEALKHLEAKPCDAVVADMHMPQTTGAQLLNEISKRHPKVLRLITSNSIDKEMVMKCILGSYDFLPKPCEPEALRNAVMRALMLDQLIGDENLKRLVGRIRTFPSIPSLYFEVLKELKNPDASSEKIGEIIAKDLAMSTKVLQVLNSAYYALPRQVTDPTEAVNILGFEMVKSLVLCIQVYSQFDKVKPYYFSIDRLWRHSTAVAHLARKIAYHEGLGNEIADESYTAGLLHDIGKLVLVANFQADYQKAQNMERAQKITMWEAEKTVFGAAHGEIGAYLIGTWGMPLSLAEAACYHHHPARAGKKSISSLTVVHAANAILYENQLGDGITPKIDEAYLAELGLEGHSQAWRGIAANMKSDKLEVREPSRPKLEVSAEAPVEKTRDQQTQSAESSSRWPILIVLGIALLVVGGLVCKHFFFH